MSLFCVQDRSKGKGKGKHEDRTKRLVEVMGIVMPVDMFIHQTITEKIKLEPNEPEGSCFVRI